MKWKVLLEGDKCMSDMHLRQLGFTVCQPFTKNREKIEKFKETGDLKHIKSNKIKIKEV